MIKITGIYEGELHCTATHEPSGNTLATEIPMDECAKLLSAGWKDASGKPAYIPIGSFGDPHHGTCYRIYNLDRELRGHAYVTASAPKKPGPAWRDVVGAL